MNLFWNNRVKNLSPYVPGEQPKDRKFIKLNTNENPYPPSPAVIEAIKKAADEKLRLYPDPECTELRQVIANYFSVKPEQVFAGNGSDEILGFAFGAFFESGKAAEKILFPDITYSFYPVYANLWDIPYETVPLCDDYSININEYKKSCAGVVIPNPNAPTGTALELDNVLSLTEYLKSINKVFIVDEAYIAFGAKSAIPYIDKYPNMLLVHTLSKSFSLAGLRVGFAIGNEKLIEGLKRIRDSFNSYTLDRLAMAGACAAISDIKYYNEINNRVAVTRDRTVKNLTELGFTVLPSSANFIFIKPPVILAADLFILLRERGILVRHFNKERISGFLRVSIGTDEEMNSFLEVCKEIK